MRLFFMLALAAGALALAAVAQTTEQVCRTYNGAKVCQQAEPHAVLLKIKSTSNETDVIIRLVTLLDAKDVNYLALTVPGTYKFHSNSLTAQQMYDKLNGDPDLAWVEPNAQAQIVTHNTPNDPWWATMQWWLGNSAGYQGGDGLGSACEKGIDPGFPSAWDITTGSQSVAVLINDTGIDYTNPDIAPNIWSAPTSFTLMIDGAPLTCPAGTHGVNVVVAASPTCDPMDSGSQVGHGTGSAGMVGAAGNNGIGVTGSNWAVTLVGINSLSSEASYYDNQVAAFDVAMQLTTLFPSLNLRIVNNSWTYAEGTVPSEALHDAMVATASSNLLLTFAAGNTGDDIDQAAHYTYPPSWYADIPNMLTVGGVRCYNTLYGNWGPNTVPLTAPGLETFDTVKAPCGGTFPCGPGAQPNWTGFFGGTSAASPVVAGAAALLVERCGTSLPGWSDLKSTLLNTVTVDPTYSGFYGTSGRLNAAAALVSCTAAHPVRVQHAIGVGN